MFLITEKLLIRNCIFAIGGRLDTVEVIGSNEFYKTYQHCKELNLADKAYGQRVQVLATLNLPYYLIDNSSVITNENELLIIGGFFWFGRYWPKGYEPIKSNLVLQGTKWINHSVLLQPRSRPISICMPNGIYVFGGRTEGDGINSTTLTSSEFLARGTSTWQNGPKLPAAAEFMDGGQGVAISETELVFMGGVVKTKACYDEKSKSIYFEGFASKQIWKFNTISEEWHLIGNLKIARFHHKAVYLNGNVIVSGGKTITVKNSTTVIRSTEIFDPHINDVEPILVGKLNVRRSLHGMGTILKNGIRTIIAFGGFQFRKNDLSSIEEWDPEKKEWTLLKQKLSERRFI